MKKKKVFLPSEDYKDVVPEIDSETLEELYPPCVMCDKPAFFVAPETNECLCRRYKDNNDEARNKNIWGTK